MMEESKLRLPPSGNAILDVVREDYPFLNDLAKFKVRLKKNQQLIATDRKTEYIYFPIDTLISLRCDILSGYTAEFSQIGRDGIVGFTALISDDPAPSDAVTLTTGNAYRIDTFLIRKVFDGSATFRRAILSYMKGHMQESAQRIVCNRYHKLLSRSAAEGKRSALRQANCRPQASSVMPMAGLRYWTGPRSKTTAASATR